MAVTHRPGFGFLVLTLAAAAATSAPQAQTRVSKADATTHWVLHRTADGLPDFQGVWANNTVTPLQRPKQWEGKTHLTDAEVAELQKFAAKIFENDGDAQFGDGLILAVLNGISNPKSYDPGTGNYNQFWLVERDWHDPRLQAGYNSYFQIIQSPGYVTILSEMAHDARIIPLDGRPHLDARIRSWNGDSRGHWEGDTLVVDTTNFSPKSDFMGSHENLRLAERFTRVGPEILEYQFTVNDPATWTAPWTVMIPLKLKNESIYEYACHEGNEAIPDMLRGHRFEEREAARKSQPK